MVDREHRPEATVTTDGITVYQTFQPDEFEVPTVGLKLVSDRRDLAHVELSVELPPALDIEEVGFHPDYDRDNWSVSDGTVSYETEIGSGEEVTTMYAVESVESDELEALLSNLSIETVDSLEEGVVETDETEASPPDAETADAEDAETKEEEVTDRDTEVVAQSDGDTEAADIDATEAADEPDESDEAATAGSAAERETEPTAIGDGEIPKDLSVYATTDLLGELARRENAGNLSAADRKQLKEFATGADDSLEARVTHLQQRMSDVEAYTDRVERLYEEHGDPRETHDAFEDRLDAFADQLASVEDEIEQLQTEVESVQQGQGELESEMSDLIEWQSSVRTALDALTGD